MQTVELTHPSSRPSAIKDIDPDLQDVLRTLGSRLFRRALASQYVDVGHPVLAEEDRLIQSAILVLSQMIEEVDYGRKAEVQEVVYRSIRVSAERSPVEDPDDPDLLTAVLSSRAEADSIVVCLMTGRLS
jgi:hypothetical protein